MKVKAVAPWFGGKRTMAPEIVAQLGPHTQYFEPFCGSAAVLFAKEPAQKETVGDLHRDLINLMWCVADPEKAPVLYDNLVRAPFSDDLLKEAQSRLEKLDPVDDDLLADEPSAASINRAYWYFLASWCGRNGTAGTERLDYQLAVRWTASGGSPTVRFAHAVESLPAWHYRLQNVVILRRDAFTWLHKIEDISSSVIYADPPYVLDKKTRGSESRYEHDFDSETECPHTKLAGVLRAYKSARVVVSYYDCPLVRELYEGWTFIDKSRQKFLHNQNGRGNRPKHAPEVLIINGPDYSPAATKQRQMFE